MLHLTHFPFPFAAQLGSLTRQGRPNPFKLCNIVFMLGLSLPSIEIRMLTIRCQSQHLLLPKKEYQKEYQISPDGKSCLLTSYMMTLNSQASLFFSELRS